MPVAARSIGEALVTIAGRDRVRDDIGSLDAAIVDGLRPRWVVGPASIDELSRVIALAQDAGLAVVPRGTGSSLELGHPPSRVDVVLDLADLDRVIEYNPDDLTITVQAGMAAGTLAALLAPHRQWLPIDPPGIAARTLGGVTATNASGPLRARFGGLRDLLLGVRFVQPDGVVTWGGSKVVKSVSGYDVPKLMVGALGTLGVLTELTLRLHARPEVERTALVLLPDASAVQALVARILDSSLQPNRLEAFDAATTSALGAGTGAGVAVSFGSVEAAAIEQVTEVARLARRAGALAITTPSALWPAYERVWHRDAGATLLTVGS